MVLTKPELITALQNEVRIPLPLAGKVDRTAIDDGPTATQRTMLELLARMTAN